jgi:hypothetical protein
MKARRFHPEAMVPPGVRRFWRILIEHRACCWYLQSKFKRENSLLSSIRLKGLFANWPRNIKDMAGCSTSGVGAK